MHATLNPNLLDTGTPPIPEAYAWVGRYDGKAGPLMNMAQAAPGTPPPPELLERLAHGAADPAAARYGAIFGDEILRKAFAMEQSAVYGADIGANTVHITAGCNLAFFVTMLAVAKPGDNVLLPAPWYFNHQMALQMLGIEARPLPLSADNGFIPDAAAAAPLIDAGTRAIVLVTPNNPTGAIYPASTIAAFADLAIARGLWLVVDETYRDFLPETHGRPHELFRRHDWHKNIVQLYSFSKAYCMPGHRLGAITAGGAIVPELEKALDTMVICPPRPAQAAVAWGIGALTKWRKETRDEIVTRGEACRQALAGLNDWRVSSLGAYFAFVRHPFPGTPSIAVAEAMAMKRGVLALPGTYFGPGQDSHIRIAFANAGIDVIGQLPDRLRGLQV
jgi:aspartate/methionine/tyrosine aminotransferase